MQTQIKAAIDDERCWRAQTSNLMWNVVILKWPNVLVGRPLHSCDLAEHDDECTLKDFLSVFMSNIFCNSKHRPWADVDKWISLESVGCRKQNTDGYKLHQMSWSELFFFWVVFNEQPESQHHLTPVYAVFHLWMYSGISRFVTIKRVCWFLNCWQISEKIGQKMMNLVCR